MKHHPSWTALRSYAITAGLACLMGVSYELFVFPNAFAPAGINGLATMLQYLLHVNIGYLSLLINLPLVLLAWKKVDRDFARKTLVFVLVFSAVTLVLGQMDLSAIAYDSGSSAILGPVAAGVVSGAVYGWVIRQNGSTGGTDIVAAWVRKKHPEASLVWLIFSLNAAVAVLSFFVYGCQFEPVILCLIYCYLSSSISDTILKGGKSAMKFEVVTRQPEELSRQLMQQLRHGVTVLQAEGMYSETPRSLLICVVNRHQVVRFQEILARFPDTFACVSSVNETWSSGTPPSSNITLPGLTTAARSSRSKGNGGAARGFTAKLISSMGLSSAATRLEWSTPQILQRWMMAHSPPLRTQTATGSMVPPQSAARSPGSSSRWTLARQLGQWLRCWVPAA